MRVISPGWGRTGTTSLAAALTRLGAGPCLQMNDLWARPDVAALFTGELRRRDWATDLAGWGATVAWPGCWIWRELTAAHPDAPVLLTVREPDEWFDSMVATIHAATPPGRDDLGAPGELIRRIWSDDFGSWEQAADRDHATSCFQAHYDAVRAAVPADRLVEWSVNDGWTPICKLLDVPVPDEPFPRLWTREQFA